MIKEQLKDIQVSEDEFEEDAEPTWLVKQREDALLAEKAYAKKKKLSIKRVTK